MPPKDVEQKNRVNILKNASQVVVAGGSLIGVQNNFRTPAAINELYHHVAPNAILNAGGRADPVRCYPGTRKEVIARIERWIDGTGGRSSGIFWLSGPAGAGKSAIVQTIAERCLERRVLMANFFFFRADSTRDDRLPLVPTLLYQICQVYPQLNDHINDTLEKQPLIFKRSIRDQVTLLLHYPGVLIQQEFGYQRQIVLLIDGLDECASEARHEQQGILHALNQLIALPDSPFIVLVASRPEPQLTMTFNEIISSPDSIFLDDNYRPADDIRLYVIAELNKVKSTHHLGRTISPQWPSATQIDAIVQKSSGQFIYAATVMRFIANSAASPAVSLDKVQGIRPVKRSSPFAELDAIYTYILSQAEDWDAVKQILATYFILVLQGPANFSLIDFILPLGYDREDVMSSVADLTAVMTWNQDEDNLQLYHASLGDFVRDKTRSGEYHIDLDEFAPDLALAHAKYTEVCGGNGERFCNFCEVLSYVKESTTDLQRTLASNHFSKVGFRSGSGRMIDFENLNRSIYHLLSDLERLYFTPEDTVFYRLLLKKWLIDFENSRIRLDPIIFNKVKLARELWDEIMSHDCEISTAISDLQDYLDNM